MIELTADWTFMFHYLLFLLWLFNVTLENYYLRARNYKLQGTERERESTRSAFKFKSRAQLKPNSCSLVRAKKSTV